MTTKSKQLVRAGHELASELKAGCGAVDMRSVANLLTELASALDVQSARSDALTAKLNDVCAENAALKSNLMFWDADDPEIPYEHPDEIAGEYDLDAGVIFDVQVAARLPNRKYRVVTMTDDECRTEQVGFDEITTPATDAWVNEQRAAGRVEGVNFAAARLAAAFNHGFIDKPTAEVYDVVKAVLGAKEELATAPDDGLSGEYAEQALNDWAAQLRGGQV